VSLDCEKKGPLCPREEINLVRIKDAQQPNIAATVATLAPAEKSRVAYQTRTLTASSLVGPEVYALVLDPSQSMPVVFKIINTTSISTKSIHLTASAVAVLANASTLDIFPAPIGLVASTADGKLYRVDPLNGGAPALPVSLPAGHINGGLSTTDGTSRLFLYSTNSSSLDDDDNDKPTNFYWYVATFDLVGNAITFSAGAPFGKYLADTYPVGFHYNAAASAASNSDSASAIIQTSLGPYIGTLDLTNTSNFVPTSCPDGHHLLYLDYDPVDGPQTTFMDGHVFYALMDHVVSDDQRHMTWVDLSARCPSYNYAPFYERSCSAVWLER
jgi:hypothetical protein